MSDFLLQATTRTERGKIVDHLRRAGLVPAVVYGHGTQTRSLSVDASRLLRLWQKAGESSLIDLQIDGATPLKAIIHDVQLEPKTSRIVHADFHQVNMKENVHVQVPLAFHGEAPAVKELGGILVTVKNELDIECLPGDLVKEIPVDLSVLATLDAALYVRDIVVPSALTVLDQPEEVIAQIEEPRSQEEIEKLNEAVTEDVSAVADAEPKKVEETEEGTPEEKPKET